MGRVVHFEIHASLPQAAIAFYGALLGWSFVPMPGFEYWVIQTGAPGEPGIDGGLVPRRGEAPLHGQAVNAFVCTAHVDSVDHKLERAVALGGQVALPKVAIPGIGWLAYIKDPDGNILGLMQQDPSAR
ncbi:MAG: VOC family protein [Planctomycetes bacterium]|nr:VOC family protein [Planctomycetota bacterium]